MWAIRRGDRTAFLRNMAVTVVLGIVFLVMQATDYALLGSEGLTLSSGTFGTTYYTLTGFHGAHVFGGVIMLSVVLYRGMAGQFSPNHHDAVEAASLYWHFVDVVWILLFSLLYLLPGKRRTRRSSCIRSAIRATRSSSGLIFVVIAVIYWAVPTIGGWHVDYAGTTMLIFLGVAMALMAYVLVAGSHE